MKQPDLIDDPQGWIQAHSSHLVLFARQWVSSYADAEDVVQDALLKFWHKRHQADKPLALLCSYVKRTAQNWQRSQSRRQRHEADYAQSKPLMTTSCDPQQNEQNRLIAEALEKLPGEQREVLTLRIWSELSFPEIAEALEIPLGTADARYRLGLRKLKDHLT